MEKAQISGKYIYIYIHNTYQLQYKLNVTTQINERGMKSPISQMEKHEMKRNE